MIESAREFRRLRTSADPVEYERASRDDAPLSVWHEIVDSMPDMRSWVAHNKTVPVEILERLSSDGDADVRAVVASRRKLPEAIQLRLFTDVDQKVRRALVYNAKATAKVLELLAGDAVPAISSKAMERRK